VQLFWLACKRVIWVSTADVDLLIEPEKDFTIFKLLKLRRISEIIKTKSGFYIQRYKAINQKKFLHLQFLFYEQVGKSLPGDILESVEIS